MHRTIVNRQYNTVKIDIIANVNFGCAKTDAAAVPINRVAYVKSRALVKIETTPTAEIVINSPGA